MLPLERQNTILELVSQRRVIIVEAPCSQLYFSGATIRRDLKMLAQSGLLRRTHGGAVFVEDAAKDSPAMLREAENPGPKSIIAQKACALIRDGQTLFLDSSTTACRLAERLTGFGQLRVVTNGLKTAMILSEIPGIQVYATGGKLRENAQSFVGTQTTEAIARFHADLVFFSCRGIHPDGGHTGSKEDDADVKKAYLQNASRSVLLGDSSKLGRQMFCRVGPIASVWKILSDIPLPAEYRPETAGAQCQRSDCICHCEQAGRTK